jgi:hypothetical protein
MNSWKRNINTLRPTLQALTGGGGRYIHHTVACMERLQSGFGVVIECAGLL